MAKHKNDGNCEKCHEFLNEDGCYPTLRSWFTIMQAKNPEVHIFKAGVGEEQQERFFDEGKSKARWKESPHNYSPVMALDLFQLTEEGKASFGPAWYENVLLPEKPQNIVWGGHFKSFKDSVHFEVKDWKKIKDKSLIWKKC